MAVAASWKRITVWLEQHLPALRLTLNAPATLEAIAKFESKTDLKLPNDVKESWLIHDGQRKLSHEEETGALAIPRTPDFFMGTRCFRLSRSVKCRHWHAGNNEAKSPAKIIATWIKSVSRFRKMRSNYGTPIVGGIPLGEFTDSDFFGIDLDPGPAGQYGQVFTFGRDQEQKFVLAPSWDRFLSDFADELEAGNFKIDMDDEYREFEMERPRAGDLLWNRSLRAEAKLASRLLG
jgi:cell wall assembly regulator SMI1